MSRVWRLLSLRGPSRSAPAAFGLGRLRLAARALCALALLLAVAVACAAGSRRPAWERPPPAARDAPVVQAERLHRYELSNGL